MNKEQQELVGDAYNNYGKRMVDIMNVVIPAEFKDKGWVKLKLDYQGKYDVLSQEEFINKCKTDPEFSEKWGLKIEEKELSTQERNEWFQIHLNGNNPFMKSDWKDFELDQQNIPTKQITLEYNNEKTYYYE
jgi:hypothetical protein